MDASAGCLRGTAFSLLLLVLICPVRNSLCCDTDLSKLNCWEAVWTKYPKWTGLACVTGKCLVVV